VTTCGCQNTCSCGTQGITIQAKNPVVINVVPPTAAQSTQSTVVVAPGQGGARGLQGTTGPQGTQGLQGTSGATLTVAYHHIQGSSSNTWTIPHNLNFFPNITTMDSAGAVCEGEIQHVNRNTARVTFSSPFSGDAYLS